MHFLSSTKLFLPNHLLYTSSLQLRLLCRHRSAHHIPYVTRRLVKEECHALAAEVLADDIELNAVLVDHVCDSVENHKSAIALRRVQYLNEERNLPPTIVHDLGPAVAVVVFGAELRG